MQVEIFEVSETSPSLLVKASSEGVLAHDLHGFTTTIATTEENSRILVHISQANGDKVTNQDAIPFIPPAKSAGPLTRGIEAPGGDVAHGDGNVPKTVVLPMMASTEPSISVPQVLVSRQDKVVNRDQGPWSREAFDLFDWRPGPSIKGDSLEVG
jgi:hypothetical protein